MATSSLPRKTAALFAAVCAGLLLTFAFMGGMQQARAASPQADSLPAWQHGPSRPEASNLDISVRASTQNARPGDVFSYTIAYSNTTGQAINNVVITASISGKQIWDGTYQAAPPLGTFQSKGNEVDGYTLSWQVGTLNAGAQGSIIFNVQAITTTEPASNRSIIFLGTSAVITTTQSGISGAQADDVVTMVGPLLEISKVAAPSTVKPGYVAVYTLTVDNIARLDAIPATTLVVSDVLPEFSTFQHASDGGYYSPTLGTVRWEWPGPLTPGSRKVLTFSVRINPDTPSRTNIRNRKNEYFINAAELFLGPLQGKKDVTIRTGSLLEKRVVSAASGSGAPKVYPDEYVTYTLTVFNPLTETLNGVVVTDTLPGTPVPFTYVGPAGNSPPPDGISSNGRTLTWTVDLPPWGWITRTFVTQIPRQTEIAPNRTEKTYYNTLDARHALAAFPPENTLAPVKAQAAVVLDKKASASHVMDGDTVVYTITLTNRVNFSVTNITLTDTLEGQFRYIQMVQGPSPLPGYQSNPVVWSGLALQPGEVLELAFEARVKGDWLVTYRNNLDARSPDVFIPSRSRIASVRVDPPLGINKGVTPKQTFINTNVTYAITITNISTVPFTLADTVRDTLPNGFYQVGGDNPGGNPAVINLPSPVVLSPGGSWLGSFTAYISPDYGCNKLPKTIKNLPGSIVAHVTSPLNVYIANSVGLAPFTLNPNIEVDLVPEHTKVLRNEVFNYELHLNNVSPTAANNSTVQVILPTGIAYLQTVSGTPPNVNGQTLSWNNLTIPANAAVTIGFQVQVNASATTGDKRPSFTGAAYGVCFSKLGGGVYKADGKVTVVDYALVVYKKARQTDVPPLAQVEYDIWLENKLDYAYTVQSITDTLPDGFTYYLMSQGNDPDTYDGTRIIWRNVTLSPGKTLWQVRLLAAPLYGTYINAIDAFVDTVHRVSVDTDRSPRDGVDDASVNVLPIFDLSKAAAPAYVVPGQSVVYTITMLNLSDVSYSALRLTDTLPAGFTYYRTLSGPLPNSIGANKRTIVWENQTVNGGCPSNNTTNCTRQIVIEVLVDTLIGKGTYYNTIEGVSPSGAVPGPISTAPVTVTQSLEHLFLPLVIKGP